MTFSENVKNELLHLPLEKSCCMLSELSALTQACGSLILRGGGRMQVKYSVENAALAKRIFLLLKLRLSMVPVVQHHTNPRLGGRRILTLTVHEQDSRRLLMTLHMLRTDEDHDVFHGVPRGAMSKRCCRQAYIRGAFLGAGSMQNPENSYRIEFVASNEDKTAVLQSILRKCGIESGITNRRGSNIIYISSGDQVADTLTLMGAQKAMMSMEDIRIRRSARGQANRATNCDKANFGKQMNAAEKQIAAIESYCEHSALNRIPEELRTLAKLRLNNPDASLEQLGTFISPPLSKSGVNNRMRKLMTYLTENSEANL